KQNIGGSATEVFTGHYSGPVSGTFSVSQAQPFSVTVPIGTYTITEDSGAGFTYVGGFAYSPFNGNCSTLSGQGSEQPGPVTVDIAVGQPGGDPTKAVCLVNARAPLTIQKQNIGGSATEVFTGHYSGPVSGTFSVSQAQPFSVSVPIGTYTITEDSGAGFTYVGGFAYSPFNGNCSTLSGQGSEQPGPVTVDIAVGQPGGDPTKAVCLVNARAPLTIQKQNIGGSATEVFTGHYSGPVSGTFSVSQAQPFSVSVPIGTYTITEDSEAGFTYVGGFAYSPFNGNCSTLSGQGSEQPGPVTVDIAVGQPGGDPTKAVCLVNARAPLTIQKQNIGGSATEVFTGHYSG